jgi:hypothetical protein
MEARLGKRGRREYEQVLLCAIKRRPPKLDLENYPHLSRAEVALTRAAHYLKQLRLPSIVREFAKLAEQCAKEGATFEQFRLRLVEQEMLDRERRASERRIKSDLRFSGPPCAEQEAGSGAGAV